MEYVFIFIVVLVILIVLTVLLIYQVFKTWRIGKQEVVKDDEVSMKIADIKKRINLVRRTKPRHVMVSTNDERRI